MRERGILFKAEMVRAILAGKTQTRRVMSPQPEGDPAKTWPDEGRWGWPSSKARSMLDLKDAPCACPYGYKGDRLWVRETHAIDGQLVAYDADGWAGAVCDDGGGGRLRIHHGFVSTGGGDSVRRGDDDKLGARFGLGRYGGRWRPSIHMPRWASRILLEVVAVRVERLQDITEADILAEGVTVDAVAKWTNTPWSNMPTLHHAMRVLWDSINGDRAGADWESNPWVWVVIFKLVKQ